MSDQTPATVSALVERIAERAKDDGITIAGLQEVAGQRIAGPMLFFPAMLIVSPLSLIPTLPTIIAVIVVLVATQSIVGRKSIWLPRRLREACLSKERAEKALRFMRPAARWLDTITRPRLKWLVTGIGARVAAMVCVLVALTMPPLEFLPGASTIAGSIIAVMGLSLTTEDGALLLIALLCVIAAGFVVSHLILRLF